MSAQLSPDVLAFLRDMLGRQTLAIGAENYRQVSALVGKALDQLDTALVDSTNEG